MKHKLLIATAVVSVGLFASCLDEFADLNSKPSDITQPNIRFLFTQCAMSFQPGDYSQWYGGFTDMSTWAQTTVPTDGNSVNLNRPDTEANGCGYQVNEVLRYTNDIRYLISQMPDDEKKQYEYIQYLCHPMLVYLSIEDTDMFGSRQYSEAEMARYTNPPLLLPKYDTQEELFNIWLKELDEALNYFKNNQIADVLSSQDFIYKGNLTKWAKLTNSLKLRIGQRLLTKDKARAIKIVEEAAADPVGLISSLDDDMVYNKGKRDNNWNNDITNLGAGSKHLIDFMIKYHDPRMFYFFMKNDYNANVVQGYFDANKDLPYYIAANVEFKEEGGKKVFTGWKAPGEPWVRYYGLPHEVGAKQDSKYNDYFDPTGNILSLDNKQGAKKIYTAVAGRNKETVKGGFTYTYPDAPDVAPVEDKEPYGWYGLYFSSGEVNLILAEFKLLGANLPQSAQQYLTDGVRLSVQGYDFVAGKNHIPYYDSPYVNDKFDVSIKLTSEMLDNMVGDAYTLTGDKVKDLEKVYIQQYIHYIQAPMDQYVTVRRSGVPMRSSSLLPMLDFDKQLGTGYMLPRRFPVTAPSPSDQLYDITIKAYQAQGYTYEGTEAINPAVLNKERVWYDDAAKAPNFGEGPSKLVN